MKDGSSITALLVERLEGGWLIAWSLQHVVLSPTEEIVFHIVSSQSRGKIGYRRQATWSNPAMV